MAVKYGLLVQLEAKPGKGEALGDGEIPKALGQVAEELLASDPDIRPVDLIAVK